jgi:deoxyribodipyrimidine photo-lyase
MNPERLRIWNGAEPGPGPVVYWMSRDQRLQDNWALIHAQALALERRQPLAVVFCLTDRFLGATARQYHFMLAGLQEFETGLTGTGIPFFLLRGEPGEELPRFAATHGVGTVVTDFDPLRIKCRWKEEIVRQSPVTLHEVDAHNIVPCWIASAKREYAARTFRPRILAHLAGFSDRFPALESHPFAWPGRPAPTDWRQVVAGLRIDPSVSPVHWIAPGEAAARQMLTKFIEERLPRYAEDRNNPLTEGQSDLSPYLHFGQLSAQRIASEIGPAGGDPARQAFLEELIVRRELSDNFCFYEPRYDSPEAWPHWARATLRQHAGDKRPYRYRPEQLDQGQTHDPLWNAAQMEMVKRGKMHGYLRMYWAKKILEWSETPEEALALAIGLNDRYELDGRDPNGFAGCAWAIGGLHDRPWFRRPVFGTIRYMNASGCRRKFDVPGYIAKIGQL